MRTAVLISGQARSFARISPTDPQIARRAWARECFSNQRWQLYRKLENPEFFVSLADDAEAALVEPLLLKYYPREIVHVEIVKQPTLPEPPIDATLHSAWGVSSPFQSILRDLWHRQRVWEFYLGLNSGPPSHQIVLRVRPDIHFHRINLPKLVQADEVWTPFWGNYGGCNDRLAIMGFSAAEVYFIAFARVPELLSVGCPMHPETLTASAVELSPGIRIRRALDAHFAALRPNGELVMQRLEETLQGFVELQLDRQNGIF